MIGRHRAWAVVLVLTLTVVVLRGSQGMTAQLVLLSPTPETVISGQVMFEAEIRPTATAIRSVEFYVDGQKACAAPAPPYRCSWDAGSTSSQREILVVAQL